MKRLVRILDLFCGAGGAGEGYRRVGFDVTGVDISEVQIERARELVPGAEFIRGDVMKVDFPSGSFDAIVSFYAIIHMPLEEHQPLIGRIRRWLTPGGYFMATVGHTAWTGEEEAYLGVQGGRMFWSHADEATYVRWMTEAGFDVLWTRFIPEDESGHSLILARVGDARAMEGFPPAGEQQEDRLSREEAEVIASALESGRRWSRRGRTGYALEFSGDGFHIVTLDEDREEAFLITGHERFILWLCDLDVSIRGYANSWSYLRMDFGMESLEEWTERKQLLSGP